MTDEIQAAKALILTNSAVENDLNDAKKQERYLYSIKRIYAITSF